MREGGTTQFGDQPMTTNEWTDHLAPRTRAVLAVGTWATYGGIPAILNQLVFGTRSSRIVALAVTAVSIALGWIVGLTAGFIRRLEGLLMGVTGLILALPDLPLVLLVLTLVGATRLNLILVLSLLSWPAFARVVRAIVIGARAAPYVEASRSLGASDPYIAVRHLLPATLDALPTKLVLTVRYVVFAEATLAFLGLSAGGTIGWGGMLNEAFRDPLLFSRPVWPWLVLPPSIAIALLILATVGISSASGSGPGGAARSSGRQQDLSNARSGDGSLPRR